MLSMYDHNQFLQQSIKLSAMRTYRFHLVNVFVESDNATFGGNPLCVFDNAEGMTDGEMLALTSQFNLSETSFVLPRTGQSPRVRIFAPGYELPFAGHPTIGTAYVVNALKLAGCEGERLTLSMIAGDIPVARQGDGAWTLTAGTHTSRDFGLSRGECASMLGINETDLGAAARFIDNGNEWPVIPVVSASVLARITPNVEQVKRLTKNRLDRYAIYVVARVAPDRFQVRFFYPKGGELVEDPGTGSACACLGGYLLDAGETTPSQFIVTQGEFINRLNVLQLSLTADKRVCVGGRVVALGEGMIRLP